MLTGYKKTGTLKANLFFPTGTCNQLIFTNILDSPFGGGVDVPLLHERSLVLLRVLIW